MGFKNPHALEIAGKIGVLLEREPVQDVGIALGIILGQFILLLEDTDAGASRGIDAIATDAKDVARKLRRMRN